MPAEEPEIPFLPGVIDTHVHSSPDVIPRKLDDLELVRQAEAAGMRGLILKSHVSSTCERAYLLNQISPRFRVFGGLVLNDTIGGFNPRAVETALKMGATQIWMPTRSAANHAFHLGGSGELTIRTGTGAIRPEVTSILQLIADARAVLATGHLSPEESERLIDAALTAGVQRISVTHPEWIVTGISPEQQRKWAATGCVWFERCLVTTQPDIYQAVTLEFIVNQIRAVGIPTTLLATDYGMPHYDTPVQGMADYLDRLRQCGFSDEEVHTLSCVNPARFLRLPPLDTPTS